MAAIVNELVIKIKLRSPLATNAPIKNSSESPGKKGVRTNPVSQKIIKNRKTTFNI